MEHNQHYLEILRQDNKKYLSLQETAMLCSFATGLNVNSLWFLQGFHTKGRIYEDTPHFIRSGNREYFIVDNIKFQNLEYAMKYLLITSLVAGSKITDDKIEKIRNIIQNDPNYVLSAEELGKNPNAFNSFAFKGFITDFKIEGDDLICTTLHIKTYRFHTDNLNILTNSIDGFFKYKIRSGEFFDYYLFKYYDEILEIDDLTKHLKLRDNFIEFSWIAEEWFFEVVNIIEDLNSFIRYTKPISVLDKSTVPDDIKLINETEKLFIKLSFYKEKIDAVVDWKRLATSFDKFKECNNKVCHCKKICKLMPLDCLSHYGCLPFSFNRKDGCMKEKKSKFILHDLQEYKQKELIDTHKTESNAQFHLNNEREEHAKKEFNEIIKRISKYWNFKKFFINEVLDNHNGKGCYILLNKIRKKIIACDVKSIVFGLSFHNIYGSFIIINNGKDKILPESYYEVECDREEIIKIINGENDGRNCDVIEKDGQNDDIVFELQYTPQRDLFICNRKNGTKVKLCKNKANSINYKILRYLTQNPNRTFTRTQLERSEVIINNGGQEETILVLGKSESWGGMEDKNFSQFCDDIKMQGCLKALFFGKDFSPLHSICLTNPITKTYMQQSQITYEDVCNFLQNIGRNQR